jgi:hypothetical protein
MNHHNSDSVYDSLPHYLKGQSREELHLLYIAHFPTSWSTKERKMRLATAAFAAAIMVASVHAFQPSLQRKNVVGMPSQTSSLLYSSAVEPDTTPCSTPDNMIIPVDVTAKALRSAIVTNANGEMVSLGEQMGKGASIVVFLRHLG